VIELQIEAILGMDKESCVNTKDFSYRGICQYFAVQLKDTSRLSEHLCPFD